MEEEIKTRLIYAGVDQDDENLPIMVNTMVSLYEDAIMEATEASNIALQKQREDLLKKVEECVPKEFKRQSLGNKWNFSTGEMLPYWCQTKEEIDYYNSCRAVMLNRIKEI